MQKDTLALARETFFVDILLLKGQVGDAMRNHADLLCRAPEYLLQNLRGVLAQDDLALGACGNLVHYNPLVKIRRTKHRMEGCYHRHFKSLQKLHDMVSGLSSENSEFMLQAYEFDVALIQELGGFL
jgi:hypothetical protein